MSVAQLNNKAMSLLLDGGSQLDAIGILKQALQILRSAPIPTPLVEIQQGEQLQWRDVAQTVNSVAVKAKIHDSNKVSFQFLYQRAFLVSEEEPSRNLKTAVVLYNLALMNHLIGLETEVSKRFVGASNLYSCALDIIKTHCRTFGSQRALLVIMGIANNHGILNWQQSSNLDEARKCFALVQDISLHAGTFLVSEQPFAAAIIDEDQYSLFLMNAIILGTKGSIASASAA